MTVGSLSRRYTRALMGLAEEENQVREWGKILGKLALALSESPEILGALADATFPRSQRLAAVREVVALVPTPPLVTDFLLLLVEKERVALLPEIAKEYGRMSDEILGIVRVAVTAVEKLESAVLKKMEAVLNKGLQKEIVIHEEVDPAILGGLKIKIGQTVYDGSLQRELIRIQERMIQEPMRE